MTRALTALFALTLTACGFGSGVGQAGSYEIIPSAHVTDSALYPLASLLIVEHDLRLQQTRVFYFTGELRAADLGFEDLRRIAIRHDGFAMAFDAPLGKVEVDPDADAGVEQDADAGPIEGHGTSLQAQWGEQTIALIKLDDHGLTRSGAARYLTSVSSTDYNVAAYFGVIDGTSPVPRIAIERAGIAFTPSLVPAQLELVQTDALIGLSYASAADYLVFELAQTLSRKQDGSHVDALVRTTLAPGTPYALAPSLLNDVAGQGCWHGDRPIQARVHQIARSYQRQAQGDWAVIYEHIEALDIPAAAWTALAAAPQPASYCDQLE